jgi:hypothetical protein
MEERSEWSRGHPWVAGVWFGSMFGLTTGALITWSTSVRAGLVIAMCIALPSGVAFAMIIRRSETWFDRPDAPSFAPPTRRRPWSRASGRTVTGLLYFGVIAGLVTLVDLANGPTVGAALQLLFYGWLTYTARSERRVRRAGETS